MSDTAAAPQPTASEGLEAVRDDLASVGITAPEQLLSGLLLAQVDDMVAAQGPLPALAIKDTKTAQLPKCHRNPDDRESRGS